MGKFVILILGNNLVRDPDFDVRVNEKLIFVLHLPLHETRTSHTLEDDSGIHVAKTLKLGHVVPVVLILMY